MDLVVILPKCTDYVASTCVVPSLFFIQPRKTGMCLNHIAPTTSDSTAPRQPSEHQKYEPTLATITTPKWCGLHVGDVAEGLYGGESFVRCIRDRAQRGFE